MVLLYISPSMDEDVYLDIYAECLRRAHENMGYLLGEQEKDRVLGEIFSNFCIGK